VNFNLFLVSQVIRELHTSLMIKQSFRGGAHLG